MLAGVTGCSPPPGICFHGSLRNSGGRVGRAAAAPPRRAAAFERTPRSRSRRRESRRRGRWGLRMDGPLFSLERLRRSIARARAAIWCSQCPRGRRGAAPLILRADNNAQGEISPMQVVRHADARAFLERAERWLEASEMENGMALTSARNARVDESRYPKPVYWATVEDGGRIVGCAFRTPPYRLGVTAFNNTAIAAVIVERRAGLRDAVGGQRARADGRTCWPRRGAGRAAVPRASARATGCIRCAF